MINRILWAISKVDDINKTQEYVKQLAKNFNAKVFVINVIPDYQNFNYSVKEEEKIKISDWVNNTLIPSGNDLLIGIAKDLEKEGINCEVKVEQGIPSQAIIDAAKSFEVDLIVVGKGRSGNNSLLGGTALKIIRRSDTPVLCVNNKKFNNFKDILVPYKLDYLAKNNVNYSLKFAKPFNSNIHSLYVVEVDEEITPKHIIQLFKEVSETELREMLSDDNLYSDIGIGVEVDYNAWTGIINYANKHNSDLIIMNTHEQQDKYSDFLGSITGKVIQEAPCPVLTMKPVK